MRRKVLAFSLAAAMMLSMAACGEKEAPAAPEKTEVTETTETTETVEEKTETTEAAETAEPEAAPEEASASGMVLPDQFVFDGKFAVQIVGYEYFDSGEDYDYDFLNIYYDMTALDDSFRTIKRIYWSATQSDTELEDDPSSSLKYDNGDHTDDIWLNIQNGVTYRGMIQFATNKGDTSVVTVGVGQAKDEYEYFDIDPTWEMPDIRHEKFEVAKIADPAYGPGDMPEVKAEDFDLKYDLTINGVTDYSTDYSLDCDMNQEYYNIVGVSYTITNHSGKEDSPFMLLSSNNFVFQDGVSLVDTSAGKESADYGKTQSDLPLYQKIQDGETVEFVQYYKLRSDSPIEVVHRDFRGTLMGDMVFDIEPLN